MGCDERRLSRLMSFTTRKIRGESPSMQEKVLKAAPTMLRVGAIFGGLLGLSRKVEAEKKAEERRGRILKRATVILVGTLAAVVLVAGTVKALVALRILTPGTLYRVAGSDLPVDDDGFTNALLLGAGDANHDGVDLTDTIMVASVDSRTKSAVLLSIPRDLYVTKSDKMGTGRINELYRNYKYYLKRTEKMTTEDASRGALEELSREIGRKIGLPIHRVVKVDFTAFSDVVDALGGVDVMVEKDLVDNEYPRANDVGYETFSVSAGLQHFDGETALKYARSRHSTSDFDRGLRQQALITALAKKAQEEGVTSSPGKILSLLKILSEHVETTMTVSEMIGAGKLAQSLDREKVVSMGINDRSGLYEPGGFIGAAPREMFGGAAVMLPISPKGDWTEIRTFVHLLTHNRATYLARPKVVILNAGAPSGGARVLASELGRYGFVVSDIGNATADGKAPKEADKLDASAIVPAMPEDKDLVDFFSTLLDLPSGELPATLSRDLIGQVTIILGKQYVFRPMTELVPLPPEEIPADETASGSGTLTAP